MFNNSDDGFEWKTVLNGFSPNKFFQTMLNACFDYML